MEESPAVTPQMRSDTAATAPRVVRRRFLLRSPDGVSRFACLLLVVVIAGAVFSPLIIAWRPEPAPARRAAAARQEWPPDVVPGEIGIGFRRLPRDPALQRALIDSILTTYEAEETTFLPDLTILYIRLADTSPANTFAAMELLKRDPRVEYAELNHLYSLDEGFYETLPY